MGLIVYDFTSPQLRCAAGRVQREGIVDNYLVRVFAKEQGIRGFACLTTGVVNEAALRHKASPAGRAVLGLSLIHI